jgi:hypothetical protein
MPKIVRDREGSGGGGDALIAEEWVEIAGAIGPHENLPGEQILQGKTKRVKFNGAIVIANKFASGTKVLDYGW